MLASGPGLIGERQTFRSWLRFSGLGLACFVAVLLPGCSGNSQAAGASPACQTLCSETCQALSDCQVEVATDCVQACAAGLPPNTDCAGMERPDRLTCAELTSEYACTQYCATLCERAPECGSFEAQRCVRGCASESPSVCNSASVAARSCDQLKPELRLYDEAGQLSSGSVQVVGGSSGVKAFGLCKTGADCDPPLGCEPATNTCAACRLDADCERGFGEKDICSSDYTCVKVECRADADCSGRVCDTASHTCVQCQNDADCAASLLGSFEPACDVASAMCVTCTTDEHCQNSPIGPRCDEAAHSCKECLLNSDCADSKMPHCGQFGYCTSCTTDLDCAGRPLPSCGTLGACVECNADADCKDPTLPACQTDYGRCVQCRTSDQCPTGHSCDFFSGTCE